MSTGIVIVGGGPVGATLALELARHGTASCLVERATAPSAYPKMDFVNARSMELLTRLGVAGEIRRRGVPGQHRFIFHWYASLTQPPVAIWDYPSVDELRAAIGASGDGTYPAEPYQRLTGALLEEILRDRVRAEPLIDFREGWTFDALHDDGEGIDVEVRDSSRRAVRLRASYVVGCDGGASRVRRAAAIGVDVIGPTTLHCDVYFRSSDPVLRAHGRYFLGIVATGVTLVSRDEADTWTATFPYDGEAPTDPMAEVCARLGVDVDVAEVLNTTLWEGRLAVAESYRRGRVFLAGDAAHQFFPTGGHGANTGLGDAVDLGWKLAAVTSGWAGPALLDTYDAERRPVGYFNREMCGNLLEVWRRFPALTAAGASRAQLAGFLAQDAYQIDNLGIHCGYRYDSAAIVRASDDREPPWDWRRVVPAVWPGARLPCVRVGAGLLYDLLGRGFTLIDLAGGAGADMVEHARHRGIPVDHLVLDEPRLRAIAPQELILVRPDQHVAWHGGPAGATDPQQWRTVLDAVCAMPTAASRSG